MAVAEIILDPEKEYEIVNGQPEEKDMAGARHSRIGTRLIGRLQPFVEANALGEVYGPDATFRIGRNQRLPDVSFVAAARIPEEGDPEGIWEIAPDLAVEVVSPNDVWEKLHGKVLEYFAAGVKQVWLISPEYKNVFVFDSPTQTTILSEQDELVSAQLLPGFRCHVSELFKPPKHSTSK